MGLIGHKGLTCERVAARCAHKSHESCSSLSWRILTMMPNLAINRLMWGRKCGQKPPDTCPRNRLQSIPDSIEDNDEYEDENPLLTSHHSLLTSHLHQSPSSNRMIGVKVPPPGGGGSFAIFLPASFTESSTTALPEPSTISNSVTVPSGWILRRTLTTRVVPAGISPCGWFQALWNRFLMISA